MIILYCPDARERAGPVFPLDQTRAARARSAPPRSSTTDLVIRAISTKFELLRAREILSDVGVQLFTLKITQHEFANDADKIELISY